MRGTYASDATRSTSHRLRSDRSNIVLHLKSSSALALVLVCLAGAAAAQEAKSIQLDEIQITASKAAASETATGPIAGYDAHVSATGTKTATPLIETPQSISVIGATEIRDLGAQSVVQATQYTSGLFSQTFGADTRNDWFLIRGFPGQVSGYFLDGLQLYSFGFGTYRVEPFGLERLEILKGPASVLYGGSNTGGIINAVSKQPPNQFQGSIETGINTWGNKYTAFDVGGPVSPAANNTLYYRLDALARGGGTQVDRIQDDRLFIAPSIAWRPDSDTSVTVHGSYQKDRTNGENFLPYVGTVIPGAFGKIPTSLFASDPQLDTFQRNQALIGYEAEHRFNDNFTARQHVRYADLKIYYNTLQGLGLASPTSSSLVRGNFQTEPHSTQFALDNELEARFHTGPVAHTALIGLDYKRYTLTDTQGFGGANPLNLPAPVYFIAPTTTPSNFAQNYQVQNQVGVYAQEQAKLGGFTLVLSGRHDQLETSLDNRLDPTASERSADSAFTGRAGLIYTTPQGIAPYVSYSTSFDPQLGTNTGTGQELVPETGVLKEIGVKYQPVGRNISFTGALFDLTQNNVPTTDPNNVLNQIQTGQENSKGFELQAQGNITPEISVLASYTGYRLRDTQDLNTALIGKVPTNVPQNFGSLLLDYTFKSGPLSGFGAGAGPRYVGGSYATVDNMFGVPSYVLADLNVHYERGPWRAQVNVVNLTDKTYVATCQGLGACFYGDRRRALFSLAYRW